MRHVKAEVCRGPAIDGFYQVGDGLRILLECGLLAVFGVEVLEERVG